MNAVTWNEWKDTDAVQVAIIMQEAILEDFIIKTTGIDEMIKSRRFAINNRAVGLGLLGYASLIQSMNHPFTGLQSTILTRRIFSHMKSEAEKRSEIIASKLGSAPKINEYNIRYGKNVVRRHTTLLAVAPTTSNATIAGGVSPGIEPLASNYYVQKSAKGNFTIINKYLKELISNKYSAHDTMDTWESIRNNSGSVQHLTWMEEEDKEVYLTFSEINQFELVRLAAVRQSFLDQSQSLNIHISPDTDPKMVSSLYLMGEMLGIKSFYYQRSTNILRDKNGTGSTLQMDPESCTSCSG